MDNSTDVISHSDGQKEDLLDKVNHQFAMTVLPVTLLIGIESVVGAVGNILIILVYSRQYDRSNFRYFVLFLAFNDLTSCLTAIPAEVFTQLNWYKLKYSWLCKSKAYFNLLTSWNSASILLLFCFDRFRKICFPLKLQIRPPLAFKLCASLTVMSAAFVGPCVLGWKSTTYTLPTNEGPVNVTVCGKSDEVPYPVYVFLLYLYVVGILVLMFFITILNLVTARKIFCGSRMLPSKTGASVEIRSSMRDSSNDVNTVTEIVSTVEGNLDMHFDHTTSTFNLHDKADGGHKVPDGHHNQGYQADTENRDDRNETPSEMNLWRRYAIAMEQISSRSVLHSVKRKRIKVSGGKHSRKLVIMFILTMVFVVTMTMYVSITQVITPKLDDNSLSRTEMVLYFFGWRLYFVNYMVNPFLYGFMDQRFRTGLKDHLCGC